MASIHLPAFNRLPNELLLEILRYSQPPTATPTLESAQTLVNFAKVSKACIAPAQEFLYRHCDLTQYPDQTLLFLRTILSRPELGLLVRSIKIRNPDNSPAAHDVYGTLAFDVASLIADLSLTQGLKETWLTKLVTLDHDAWVGTLLQLVPEVQHVGLRAERSIPAFLRKLSSPSAGIIMKSVKHLVLADLPNGAHSDAHKFVFEAPAPSPSERTFKTDSLALPELETLEVTSFDVGASALNQITTFITPELFHSNSITTFSLTGWIPLQALNRALSHLGGLRSFTYDIPSSTRSRNLGPRDLTAFSTALAPVRGSLEHLALNFHGDTVCPELWPHGLRAFSKLETLRLNGGFTLKPPANQTNNVQMMDLFPPSLRQLTLDSTLQASKAFRESWAFEPFQLELKRVFYDKHEMVPDLQKVVLGPRLIDSEHGQKIGQIAESVGVQLITRRPTDEELSWETGSATTRRRFGFTLW
ncbi:hypothetical protein EJ04DRAFT_529148 [Polyplosphaeria fusca]|uniref:Uncharacterized protein n=1 Tax=Polyplosphaeria fusca TaxID=682080 RepID=A0A9P4QK54_9PLEO|nr:hypothetical protein EJ04DRAFT_529148 [Polyplosphaeria fusca]